MRRLHSLSTYLTDLTSCLTTDLVAYTVTFMLKEDAVDSSPRLTTLSNND